jgi:hypothetical protein
VLEVTVAVSSVVGSVQRGGVSFSIVSIARSKSSSSHVAHRRSFSSSFIRENRAGESENRNEPKRMRESIPMPYGIGLLHRTGQYR